MTTIATTMAAALLAAATTNQVPPANGVDVKVDGGVLLLNFDDRNFADWERAIPLFERHGAHATFFFCGEFTPDAVRVARLLAAHGHAVGHHGRTHSDVPPFVAEKGWEAYYDAEVGTVRRQCAIAGVAARNFAYPNNRRDERCDGLLLSVYDRLRAGIPGVRPYDPNGERRAWLRPLAEDDRVFFPAAELPRRRVLGGVIVGEAYNVDIDDVVACVRRAGRRKEALVLTSHGIRPDARGIHMKTEWLERILSAAQEAGVAVLSFDDVPLLRR